METTNRWLLLLLALAVMACGQQKQEAAPPQLPKKPNVVYIIADDLGYGDLGCYGQEIIKTPQLDQFAMEGMKFTAHYSGSTVCAPSRASLMTGLHTGHAPVRGNKEVKPEGQAPIADATYTLAELMQQQGYVTGAFGKWGLGSPGSEGDPNNQGFTEFYGYNCQRYAHRYYPEHLWHNQTKIELENDGTRQIEYAQDMIHEEALKFIEANHDTSFFLFMPIVLPHAELVVPDDELLALYKGKFEETPHQGVDYGPDFTVAGYASQEIPRATFAAMVARVDRYVGEVVEKLQSLGLDSNTVVMFTSDNGPHLEGGADPDFFNSNGPFQGYKRDLNEGGIRVPMLVRWPGKVAANSQTDHPSAFWDVMPTLAAIADTEVDKPIDGISFLPTLLGEGEQPKHEYLYWEFHEQGGKQAVRMGKWKGIKLNVKKDPNGPIALYDLEKDPAEQQDISDEHLDVIAEMEKIMKEAHLPNPQFPFFPSEQQPSEAQM